jgi:hypothetical protein
MFWFCPRIQELEKATEQINHLNQKIDALEKMLEDERNEVKKFQQMTDELRADKESFEKTNDLLNSQLTAMNNVILKLTNTNNALLTELNSLKKEKDTKK